MIEISIILNFVMIIFCIIMIILLGVYISLSRKDVKNLRTVIGNQISNIEYKLDCIMGSMNKGFEDIGIDVSGQIQKILESDEAIRQDIVDNGCNLSNLIKENHSKSNEQLLMEIHELSEKLNDAQDKSEVVQQHIAIIEEIFRLQLVNGLLDDADKAMQDFVRS